MQLVELHLEASVQEEQKEAQVLQVFVVASKMVPCSPLVLVHLSASHSAFLMQPAQLLAQASQKVAFLLSMARKYPVLHVVQVVVPSLVPSAFMFSLHTLQLAGKDKQDSLSLAIRVEAGHESHITGQSTFLVHDLIEVPFPVVVSLFIRMAVSRFW